MISGRVSDSLEATLSLSLRGAEGQAQQIDAIVDTGFSGFLTLPVAAIEALDLPWLCRQQGLLADGRIHPFDVYIATVVWDDEERTIEVEAADVDPLLGMSLLSEHRLIVEVRADGKLTIEQLQ